MAIRLIVPMRALLGKGDELVKFYQTRCAEVRLEPGCQEYEVFQSVEDPDKMALLEMWADEATLEVHLELNRKRTTDISHLRERRGEVERYAG
jgi:quinol monooxygenase YgiN